MANTKITAANIDSTSTGVTFADLTVDTTTLVVDASNNRVGIGTASPAKTLHLAAGSSVIRLEDTDGGYGEVSGSNGNIRLRADEGNTQASSFMSFDIDSTEEMRLTSTGLGIGRPDPQTKLHIEVADNTEFLRATITGNESWAFKGASVAGTSTDTVSFGIAGGTQCMTWQEDGNVGVGTISPDFTLDVEADKDTWISRIYNTGSDANAQTLLVRSDATAAHDATVMGVYADSGYKMIVKSTGKLLIGDSASHTDDLLQIETPASGGGHGIQIRRNDSNSDQGIGRIMFGNNTDTDLATIQAITDGSTDNARLVFSTQPNGGSSTERMTILESGNVVVGDNSLIGSLPTGSKLNIFGDGVTLRLDGGSNSTKSILFRGTSAGNPGEVYADGGLRLRTEDANMPITFHTNSTGSNNERMRIDNNGVRLADGAMAYEQNRPLFTGANASSYSTSTNLAYTKATDQYSVTGDAFKARVRARAYTKYVHMKTNLSADNIMFFFRIYGYFYNYGVNECVRGGYTYQSDVIQESVANAYNTNVNYTIGDFYRSSSGNYLCIRLDVHHTSYTEGEALVFFGSHSNTVTRELEITDMQHRDDGNNAY